MWEKYLVDNYFSEKKNSFYFRRGRYKTDEEKMKQNETCYILWVGGSCEFFSMYNVNFFQCTLYIQTYKQ